MLTNGNGLEQVRGFGMVVYLCMVAVSGLGGMVVIVVLCATFWVTVATPDCVTVGRAALVMVEVRVYGTVIVDAECKISVESRLSNSVNTHWRWL